MPKQPHTNHGTAVSSTHTPQAVDDTATVSEDGPSIIDVLANDKGGNAKTLYSVDQSHPLQADTETTLASGATISIVNGKLVYNPGDAFQYLNAGETATDGFDYAIQLGNGAISTAHVDVTVQGANDGFWGQTIEYNFHRFEFDNIVLTIEVNVGPGVELTDPFLVTHVPNFATIDFTVDQIIVNFGSKSGFANLEFQGFSVYDKYDVLPDIIGVSINPSGNTAGISPTTPEGVDRITFDENHINVNLEDTSWRPGTTFTLDVLFA